MCCFPFFSFTFTIKCDLLQKIGSTPWWAFRVLGFILRIYIVFSHWFFYWILKMNQSNQSLAESTFCTIKGNTTAFTEIKMRKKTPKWFKTQKDKRKKLCCLIFSLIARCWCHLGVKFFFRWFIKQTKGEVWKKPKDLKVQNSDRGKQPSITGLMLCCSTLNEQPKYICDLHPE